MANRDRIGGMGASTGRGAPQSGRRRGRSRASLWVATLIGIGGLATFFVLARRTEPTAEPARAAIPAFLPESLPTPEITVGSVARADFVDLDRDDGTRWLRCVDADRRPVAGAAIHGADGCGPTRDDGTASLAAATPMVVVVARAFLPEVVECSKLSTDERTPTEVVLRKGLVVAGVVVDDLDRPLAQARVRIRRGAAGRFFQHEDGEQPIVAPLALGREPAYAMTVETDSEGRFAFSGLADEEHVLTAEKTGFVAPDRTLSFAMDPARDATPRIVLHRVFVGALVVESACPHGGRHDQAGAFVAAFADPKGFLRFNGNRTAAMAASRDKVRSTLGDVPAEVFAFAAESGTPDDGMTLSVSVHTILGLRVEGVRVPIRPAHLWCADDAERIALYASCPGHGRVTVEADAAVVLALAKRVGRSKGDDDSPFVPTLAPIAAESGWYEFDVPVGIYYAKLASSRAKSPFERRVSDGFVVGPNAAVTIKADPSRQQFADLVVTCVDVRNRPTDQFGLSVRTSEGRRLWANCRPGASQIVVELPVGEHDLTLKDAFGNEVRRERVRVDAPGTKVTRSFVLGQ
jgi:hypothetical protein